jgi:chemotaxis protein methyltransferase CheR
MMIDIELHLTQQERAKLRKQIAAYSGWDESIQTDDALEQAVAQRLAACRLSSLDDYWPLLRNSSKTAEINNLVQILANKETFLFRETHQFDALDDWVLPQLLDRVQRPLRLWSAGCATGEEPYSLAITLLEYQARHGEFEAQVIGTDLDADALEKARQGCYHERSLRLVPEDLRQRYFRFDGGGYRVVPEVARLVTFQIHNLAKDPQPPDLKDLDIIFCRNVTIYFSEKARDRLNARLADSLREGGYLFVASAETMGHNQGRLELVSVGDTFLFHKAKSAPAPPEGPTPGRLQTLDRAPSPPSPARHPTPAAGRPRTDAGVAPATAPPSVVERATGSEIRTAYPAPSTLECAYKSFQSQDYRSALHQLDQLPADQPPDLQALCLRGAVLLQQERLEEAEMACQRLLAMDLWHADGHFLLGLVYRQQGQTEAAMRALKQAIYLQPSHRDAHFYLAETYRTAGMETEARREYENTLNTLRSPHPSKEPPALNLSGLEDEILRQACEVNLRRLGGR